MIRRLRFKFIGITMVLLTAMLLVIFALVCHFTASNLEKEARAAMHAAATNQFRPGRPGAPQQEQRHPCFSLELSPQGELKAQGQEQFDLSDTQLLSSIYQAALAEGKPFGKLESYDLRYMRAEFSESKYIFMDLAKDRQIMAGLIRSCVLIGIAALVAFFGISVALAHWSIRPVEQAWQQQRQFVADASHELKTPLTVILTNTELLRSGEYGEEEKSRFTDSIFTMSQHMRQLVESLLDLARADKPEERQEHTRLEFSALVEDAVLPFEPVYFESGRMLDSSIAPGLWVKGDERNLRQAVEILLDNGVKYADPGSTTSLTLAKQGRRLVLTVTTPGQPLTKQQCADIFKRFYRTDAARSRDGSYGLGLSIAQRIVENHGGKIWAQPAIGGNTFTISLPEG